MTKVSLAKLGQETGVGFGSSGVRAKIEDLTDRLVYVYTTAFLSYLKQIDQIKESVVIAGDLRNSTPRITVAAAKAVTDFGCQIINCGLIPTPAVCFYGFQHNIPSIMVTGSHIPDDRNGLKYNCPQEELLKSGEQYIANSEVEIDDHLFDSNGQFRETELSLPPSQNPALEIYIQRYLDFFPNLFLRGKTIALYGHSAVGREILFEILCKLGAKVIRLGFSDQFKAVDTEAIEEETINLGKQWARQNNFDAIVSTDGDSDRPLIGDENGNWLRSDILGILTAKDLGAEAVVVPVSCNTGVDKSGWFKKVVKTKIGSPYVVEAMKNLVNQGFSNVVGYEGNGGFFLGNQVGSLKPLVTRDALIQILSWLKMSVISNKSISKLAEIIPKRYTQSGSLKGFPTQKSLQIVEVQTKQTLAILEENFGSINSVDQTDGLRVTFDDGDIVHLRPSKNSPEFRNYCESDSPDKAKELSLKAGKLIASWL
ncbi:MAG: phosphomannomutase [Candidatus Shapirobacteria bacterium]|jgi:phosphomannomutase